MNPFQLHDKLLTTMVLSAVLPGYLTRLKGVLTEVTWIMKTVECWA